MHFADGLILIRQNEISSTKYRVIEIISYYTVKLDFNSCDPFSHSKVKSKFCFNSLLMSHIKKTTSEEHIMIVSNRCLLAKLNLQNPNSHRATIL